MRIKIILLLLLAPGLGFAQEKLSLTDALKMALENNFKIQIAKDQSAIAKNSNNWGEAGRYPTIDLQVTQNNNILDQSNNPTAFIKDQIISNSVNGSLVANWVLFSGFRVKFTKERLELLQAQSEGNAIIVVENTIQAVVLAYYQSVLQREKLVVLASLIKLSRDKYNQMSRKKDLGVSSTYDLLQIKNAYLADSTNFLLQQINYRNSLRNLNLLMSRDVENVYELTDFLQPPTEIYVLDTLKTRMVRNNSTILNQYINLELQRTQIDLAKSAMYPVVSFQLGGNTQFSHFETSQFATNGSNLNYYGNFVVNFNLFNGGKTKRSIQNAQIQEKIAQISLEEQVFTLNSTLVNAYELYLARQVILDLTTESYRSAEYNLKLSQERFEQGSISSFNFRDVQIQFLNAAMTRLDAAYNIISSHTELLRLTGGILQVN
jgi:outer membrane protein TolC